MLFRILIAALAAFAVGASAQTTTIPPEVRSSVLMALATALPSDSVSYALASSSAFAADIASSLSAGNTPLWYQALPSDVKSILPALYPVAAEQTTAPTPRPSSSVISASPSGHNSTAISSVRAPTLSGTSGAARPSGTSFTGGASVPSAAIGAGIAGALTFLGMLAL